MRPVLLPKLACSIPSFFRIVRWRFASGVRSGGPDSLVPWDSLGQQGRDFTGLSPTISDIQELTARPALEPVRTYAGLE